MNNYSKFLWSYYSDQELRQTIKSGSTLASSIREAKAELSNRQQSQDEILDL